MQLYAAKVIPVKLPKLEISEFNGRILNWQGFWDLFNSVIYTKTSISNTDKFSYFNPFYTILL